MKNNFFYSIKSKIVLSVKGHNLERFIKRLAINNIELLKIKYIKYDEVNLTIYKKDYDDVINLKTIYEISIVDEKGLLKLKKFLIKNIYFILSVFSSEKTDKLCVTTGFNGKISRIRKGGSNCWYMTGPAYWDNQFSARFCELMQKEYDDPGSKDLSWEAFYSNHLDELSLTLRKYPEGIVREFNSLDELCLFDTSYIPYRDSLKAT